MCKYICQPLPAALPFVTCPPNCVAPLKLGELSNVRHAQIEPTLPVIFGKPAEILTPPCSVVLVVQSA